jgi:glutamine amidotransferase
MIGIVDYEAGNIASVSNALSTINADFVVSNDAKVLAGCSGIILPGVGAAPGAMASLAAIGIVDFLKSVTKPFLGICLGMQLLYESSEEGNTKCIGVLPGTVARFDSRAAKIPHMGWNVVERRKTIPLMDGLADSEHFYFAHSYYAGIQPSTVATTDIGFPFTSVVQSGNFTGVQFHPEKSGKAGFTLLRNFIASCS